MARRRGKKTNRYTKKPVNSNVESPPEADDIVEEEVATDSEEETSEESAPAKKPRAKKSTTTARKKTKSAPKAAPKPEPEPEEEEDELEEELEEADDETDDEVSDVEEQEEEEDDDEVVEKVEVEVKAPKSRRKVSTTTTKRKKRPVKAKSKPEDAEDTTAEAEKKELAVSKSKAPAAKKRTRTESKTQRALPKRAKAVRTVRTTSATTTKAVEQDEDEQPRSRRTVKFSERTERPRLIIDEPEEDQRPENFSEMMSAVLNMNIYGPRKPGLVTMARYSRKMASLLAAGIPLVRTLKIMAERATNNRDLKAATFDVARDVERGMSLASAMEEHPNIYDPVFVGVVRTGEAGGILEDSIRRLSDILSRKATLKRQIINAMIYPALLVIMAIITIWIIMVWVVPVFMEFFEQQGESLPSLTKLVVGLSNHFSAWGIWELIILVILGLWYRYMVKTRDDWKRGWERFTLKLYRIGYLVRLINSARFARTLSGLLAAGIPLWEGLGVASKTSESILVSDAIDDCREDVEEGQKLEPSLRDSTCFLPEFLDVVAIGEETGMLEKLLGQLADDYEEESRLQLQLLLELLKPLMLIVFSLIVVLILLAVYLPYFELMTGIGG
jgi:type II secretory pathway component PulF